MVITHTENETMPKTLDFRFQPLRRKWITLQLSLSFPNRETIQVPSVAPLICCFTYTSTTLASETVLLLGSRRGVLRAKGARRELRGTWGKAEDLKVRPKPLALRFAFPRKLRKSNARSQ